MLAHIEERLSNLATQVSSESGLKVVYRIEKGRIYSKVTELAKELSADYIVMGTHGASEDHEVGKRVGANTSRVIRSANCPVITLNERHIYNGCRNILLPLDNTAETRQKVTIGIKMAKIYGAGIRVVSAIWSKSDNEIVGRLRQQGEQVANFIAEEGIDCTFELIESTEGERTEVPSILNYATQLGNIDLIIILTQQEIGIVQYFISSSAQEFIRLSDIPVMSVIPKDLGFTTLFS